MPTFCALSPDHERLQIPRHLRGMSLQFVTMIVCITASVTKTIMVAKVRDELLACARFLRGRRQHEKLFLSTVSERDTKL